jgi:CRP-like cAMP-binding protein
MNVGIGAEAFGWGILSAVSLPLGALLGLWLKPKRKVSSCLMAFGAGALLFALTIELFGHVPHHVEVHGMGALWAAIIGALIGGGLFELMNRILNNRGAYLRKLSHARKYVTRLKLLRAKKLVEELSRVPVLGDMQPDHMAQLIQGIHREQFAEGDVIFRQGEEADAIYFVVSGTVDIVRANEGTGDAKVFHIGEHGTFGELALLRGAPRSADAQAATDVHVYKIMKDDLNASLAASPELQEGIKQLACEHLDELSLKSPETGSGQWKAQTLAHFKQSAFEVSVHDIREEGQASAAGNVALAIWLGILIDGIPESLVIGMLALSPAGMSLSFIAGVFLANLPEAMSSAVSMKSNGMGLGRILLMWTSICIITGVGAFVGAAFFPAMPEGPMFFLILGVEGLAAGAMLTMIAETMLPEAFEQGGSVVGLSTLAGFLATLCVKVL